MSENEAHSREALRWLRYAIVRLLYGTIAIFGVTIILYSAFHLAPPDLRCNVLHCPEDRWLVLVTFGSEGSYFKGYYTYVRYLIKGELGFTVDELGFSREDVRVIEVIGQRLPNSLFLGGLAAGIGVPIALGIGLISAVKLHTPLGYVGEKLLLNSQSIPVLCISMQFILVFFGFIGWSLGPEADGFASPVFPVTVLALSTVGALRYMRCAMLKQLNSEHVKFARMQGLSEWKTILRHGVRIAAMAPPASIITGVSAFISTLVVVEWLFGWPGAGMLVMQAVIAADDFLLHGIVLTTATALIVFHVVIDIALAFADARVRFPETREYAPSPATP